MARARSRSRRTAVARRSPTSASLEATLASSISQGARGRHRRTSQPPREVAPTVLRSNGNRQMFSLPTHRRAARLLGCTDRACVRGTWCSDVRRPRARVACLCLRPDLPR
jgi:hypothetical protein